MTKKRILCAVAGSALTVVMTISVATPASAACRAQVRGAQISGINQTITELRARSSWRNKVRTIHGWSYARNKNMDCDKPRPRRTWSCRAIASPCDRPPRSP